jgi:uncharacterized cupin superfamily protein
MNETIFSDLDSKYIKESLSAIIKDTTLSEKEKQYLIANPWTLIYREKPPTPEEFLTYAWIGESSLSVYPHIRDVFLKFFDPNTEYRNLYLSTVIGYGKSFATSCIVLYVLTIVNLMRNPKKYFNIDQSSMIVGAVASFTIAKAKQSLSSTILRIMRNSPKFRQVKFEDRIIPVQEEEIKKGTNKIVYCKASSSDTLFQLSNDIHIVAVSDSNNLLGLNILIAAITELSFFLQSGLSDEDAMNMIQEVEGRIYSRFANNFLGRMIVDSSPFSVKNTLDKKLFITGEVEANPKNMVIKGILHWEIHKGKYPLFYNENKFFYIFRGGEGKSSIEITEEEIVNYKPDDVIKVPEDIKNLYKQNPNKTVRDYIGYPSGVAGGLISDYTQIEEIFDTTLKNELQGIDLPESKDPSRLLWDKIKDNYFIKAQDRYEFYRNPKEMRWIACDLALSGDIGSISMTHPEINRRGEIVAIIDFQIPILHTNEKINLDAFIEFIIDIVKIGNVKIKQANYDGFQSTGDIQRLNRLGINTERISVDNDKSYYYTMISYIKQGRIKAGRNIFYKNNLKSLIEADYQKKAGTKVDHTIGKLVHIYDGNWNTSLCGINAKDISDSTSSSVGTMLKQIDNYIPIYQYVENKKSEEMINDILSDLKNKYNLVIKN